VEHIRQAVELAKARSGTSGQQLVASAPPLGFELPRNDIGYGYKGRNGSGRRSLDLDPAHLESMRIIAHDIMDRRSKSYDILRTQVVRTMEQHKWQTIAVTSPTPGCGKTLTAINLALSIARQPEKAAVIVDLDLQRPRLAKSLGVKCDRGLLDILEGEAMLSEALVEARIGKCNLTVLANEEATSHSSEWMASRQINCLLQALKREFTSHVIVVDLPPILPSDEAISILPQLDCALFVASVGTSTLSDIEQCNKHLRSTEVVHVVLNKTTTSSAGYYY
jgi:Mrp family chromosome partitioning ATPase